MSTSHTNTYSHFHNNDYTKQKICPTIISNLIYIFIQLYMSKLLMFNKIKYFSYSYIFTFIYMYKCVIKMSQIQRIERISHIICFRIC